MSRTCVKLISSLFSPLVTTVTILVQLDFCRPLVTRLIGFYSNIKSKAAILDRLLKLSFKQLYLFQNIDNTWKKSSTPSDKSSKGLLASDPLSMIQAKPDTFDGLDPLSMFAAQEANTKQTVPASAAVSKKQRVCITFLAKTFQG